MGCSVADQMAKADLDEGTGGFDEGLVGGPAGAGDSQSPSFAFFESGPELHRVCSGVGRR